jgi:hypothetical protein
MRFWEFMKRLKKAEENQRTQAARGLRVSFKKSKVTPIRGCIHQALMRPVRTKAMTMKKPQGSTFENNTA